MAHKLPPLRFGYDALEPYIDAETMELHHDKHHKAYVDNLNRCARGPEPRIGRKDLQDPDREVTEPGRPARDDGPGQRDHDAGDGRPVQLEIPATEQRVAGE